MLVLAASSLICGLDWCWSTLEQGAVLAIHFPIYLLCYHSFYSNRETINVSADTCYDGIVSNAKCSTTERLVLGVAK